MKKVTVMSFCTKCGSEISQDAKFCPNCGAIVRREEQLPPPVYAEQKGVSGSLFGRMIRAAKLDSTLYEEVEADENATTQALLVVVLSSVCSGIGTGLANALRGQGSIGIGIGLLGGLVSSFLVWIVWSFITYFIGTNVFGGKASFGELLRTIGFSDSPGVLLIFSFIPVLGGLLSFAVWVWGLVAMIVAVRQALDFSTGRAVLTCIVGFISAIILMIIIGFFIAVPFIILG